MSGKILAEFAGDERGDPLDTYDLGGLGLGRATAMTLKAAFEGITATYRRPSRRQAWRSLRKFAMFLRGKESPLRAMKSKSILVEFADWLKLGLLQKTAGSHYNLVAMMYEWLADNDEANTVVWNISAPRGLFPREHESKRNNYLSMDSLRRILEASKAGILQVRHRLGEMRALAEGRTIGTLPIRDQDHIQRMRVAAMKGIVGKSKQYEAGFTLAATPYRRLKRYLFLEQIDFVPNIIYIIMETQANPSGIFDLRIDCLADHAVDPLKKVITWDKFRSNEQKSSAVLTDGSFAVPNIVNELIEATAILRPLAGRHSDRIFITQRVGAANAASVQGLHNALAEFIEKFNLPDFNYVDLRNSGAKLLGNRGASIEQVQSMLQHESSATTGQYLRTPERKALATKKLVSYMGTIVHQASLPRQSRDRYGTSQGYDCKDPISGVAPHSRPGNKCTNHLHCAVCPNSIAVLDSTKHVARMMSAMAALDSMLAESMYSLNAAARYKHAYQASHEILRALVGRVSKKVLKAAKARMASLPMLKLE
jgi:hypothetical protein